jgi:acetyl-CoA C-acetyltransferase
LESGRNGTLMTDAFIVAAVRTAGARKGGRLAAWHPADLAGRVLDALVERLACDPAVIDDVIMGCVSQAGEQGLNIARRAILSSRLPESVPGVSVDRQCGSSQQAVHFAAQAVMSGAMDIIVAAGVESMTRAPVALTTQLAEKNGFGSAQSPSMTRRYPGVIFSQFTGAEMLAEKFSLSREELDAFALESHHRAVRATRSGAFAEEIVPLDISVNGQQDTHSIDEGIRFDASLAAIGAVKLIKEGGRITAATSSQICDGAAGLVICNARGLKKLGATPLACIRHMTVMGHDPVIMLEAPLPATQLALERAGLRIDDIDLYEVNEAFAPVPIAWLRVLHADPERLNVNGGAIALGHPLGASGAKLMTTLVHALRAHNKRFGLQTMCEGGGLANVTIIERL